MPAARRPLTLDRLGAFDEVFTWVNDDGSLRTIGDQTALLTIYDGLTGVPLVHLSSAPDGGIEVEPGGATGSLYVTCSADQGRSIRRTAMYLLQLVDTDATPTDLAYGPVRLGARGWVTP